MKKIFFITVLFLGLMSCDEDVKFNNPVFEAERNYNYDWKATEFKATVNGDSIKIVGTAGDETLTIKTTSYSFGDRYNFGEVEDNGAVLSSIVKFKNKLGEEEIINYNFKTENGLGRGYIEFAAVDDQFPGTITGKFVVILKEVDNDSVVLFNKGVFYRVPMESDFSL